MKPDDTAYMRHIFDAIHQIELHTKKTTYEDFVGNDWDQAAVLRYLEIIGEAARHISE